MLLSVIAGNMTVIDDKKPCCLMCGGKRVSDSVFALYCWKCIYEFKRQKKAAKREAPAADAARALDQRPVVVNRPTLRPLAIVGRDRAKALSDRPPRGRSS